MRKVGSLLLMVLIVTLLSSCATIVSKSEWPVRITSTPEEADITIIDLSDGRKIYTGKTPATVTLSSKGSFFKGKSYRVEISKPGYPTKYVEIKSTFNEWYLGNVVLLFLPAPYWWWYPFNPFIAFLLHLAGVGGLMGLLVVDPYTGAMWTLEPKDVHVALEKKGSKLPSDQLTLSIVSIEDIPEHLRDKLIRVK